MYKRDECPICEGTGKVSDGYDKWKCVHCEELAEETAYPTWQPGYESKEEAMNHDVHFPAGVCQKIYTGGTPNNKTVLRFIVSVVMTKQIPSGINTQNKMYAVRAISREEAHGIVMPLAKADYPEHSLHTLCSFCLEIDCPELLKEGVI